MNMKIQTTLTGRVFPGFGRLPVPVLELVRAGFVVVFLSGQHEAYLHVANPLTSKRKVIFGRRHDIVSGTSLNLT